ncbi:hypothetical protein ACTXT7_014900 [Hymenolepis weldensis]
MIFASEIEPEDLRPVDPLLGKDFYYLPDEEKRSLKIIIPLSGRVSTSIEPVASDFADVHADHWYIRRHSTGFRLCRQRLTLEEGRYAGVSVMGTFHSTLLVDQKLTTAIGLPLRSRNLHRRHRLNI